MPWKKPALGFPIPKETCTCGRKMLPRKTKNPRQYLAGIEKTMSRYLRYLREDGLL